MMILCRLILVDAAGGGRQQYANVPQKGTGAEYNLSIHWKESVFGTDKKISFQLKIVSKI